MSRQYFGYRIHEAHIPFFRRELEAGVLRQGWGSSPAHDLRNPKLTGDVRGNLSIYQKVKRGDILLIPRLPTYKEVAIVEATEDFDKGYRFEICPELRDYGHCFPVKMLTSFTRHNANVAAPLRASLQYIGRFWTMNRLSEHIDILLNTPAQELRSRQSYIDRFSNTVNDTFSKAFDEKKFADELYEKMCVQFSNAEWEFALVEGLRALFPPPYIVQRQGGPLEAQHGTDITIMIPGLLGIQYVIAIQVKDYENYVNSSPLKQLSKADSYWNQDNYRLIEKILVVTKARKGQNRELAENENGIRVIFADKLQELLSLIAQRYLGLDVR